MAASAHFPFFQEVLDYPADTFPFLEQVRTCIFGEDLAASEPASLEKLHTVQRWSNNRAKRARESARPPMASGLIEHPGFRDVYHTFIKEFVRPHLKEEYILFEHNPNLRVHSAGSRALTAPHRDIDHKHSLYEVNFWLPLTTCSGSASLWAETWPGKGDFRPFEMKYGQVVRFYGNQCLHYTMENDTSTTRVSFDFRAVRLGDFWCSGIPKYGEEAGERWTLFSYYDIMGPDGLVGKEAWESFARRIPIPTNPDSACFSGPLVRTKTEQLQTRSRSTSSEHGRKCLEVHGDHRTARRHCGRCGWIFNREQLLRDLVYTVDDGPPEPWICENPDPFQPWGLGCSLCSRHRSRRIGDGEDGGLTEFSFGRATPGLLVNPLYRHGNHAKRQKENRNDNIISINDAHSAALAAVRKERKESAAVASLAHVTATSEEGERKKEEEDEVEEKEVPAEAVRDPSLLEEKGGVNGDCSPTTTATTTTPTTRAQE